MSEKSSEDSLQQFQEDVEVRLTFQEAEIQQLNLTIAQQQQVIQTLDVKIQYLAQQLKKLDSAGVVSDADETPPHY